MKNMPIKPDIKRRKTLLLGMGAFAAVSSGVGVALWQQGVLKSDTDQGAGKTPALAALWDLNLDLPQGGTYALRQLRGKRVLINFWATWCPPCVEELPLLDRFYHENAAKSWQVVGLAADNAKAVNQFLSRHPLRFPTPLAGLSGIELSRSLGNVSGALPFTVVLNTQGEVAVRHMGKLTAAQLTGFLAIS